MSTNRNTIVTAVATALATVSGFDAAHVHDGPIPMQKLADGKHHIGIFRESETGSMEDGDTCLRKLTLTIGVIIRIDPLKATAQIQQLDEVFELVHLKMEDLQNVNLSAAGGTCRMIETNQVMFSGLDDTDGLTYAAEAWEVEYERVRGTPAP